MGLRTEVVTEVVCEFLKMVVNGVGRGLGCVRFVRRVWCMPVRCIHLNLGEENSNPHNRPQREIC